MRFSFIFLFSLIILGISCSKEHDIINIEEETFTPITNIELSTLVISVDIEEPFSCIINDQIYTNDTPGVILIEDILLEKDGNLILIKSDGYIDETRYVIPSLGAHAYMEVEMTALNQIERFNAKEGGAIIRSRLEIEVDPNSIIDALGNIYEGEVSVSLKNTFSGAYASLIKRFPQNLMVEEDKQSMLHFLDGFDINITDEMLNPLFVKEGFTAKIKIKIESEPNYSVPDVVNMRHFNNEKNEWEQAGIAEKDGEWWIGNIERLGKINFGVPYDCKPAQIKLRTEEGHIVPNKFVWLVTDQVTPLNVGFSDSNGDIRMHIPLNKEFSLATFERTGHAAVKFQEYSIVGSGTEEIVILDDFILTPDLYQLYSGNLKDCNGQKIEESAIITDDIADLFLSSMFTSYFFPNDDGQYNFATFKSSMETRAIRVLDFDSGILSNEFSIPNIEGSNVEFNNFSICDESDKYVNYINDGKLYRFAFNGDFSSTFTDPNFELTFSADAQQGVDENNRLSFLIEHVTDLALFSTHQIRDLKIKYDDGQESYSFECIGNCNHFIKLTNVTTDLYEGLIKYTDNTNSEVTIGTFRLPRQ